MVRIFTVSRSGARLPLKDGLLMHWTRECFRCEATARALDIPVHYVWPKARQGALGTALRYLTSLGRTVALVRRERPRHVIMHNQPPFIALGVLLARLVNRHSIIMDFHSGGLTHPYWRRFAPFYRWLVRRSPFTFCHNRFDAEVIEGWGGRAVRLPVLPQSFDEVERRDAPDRPRLLAVCSFRPDEPIEMLLDAMARCPDVEFAMTGNYARRGLTPADMPANVTLLGFLEYTDYLRHFAASTAIITLSDRPHIMQMAVEEAISLGVPVITNESETLREALEGGGVFCALTADSVAQAVRQAVMEAAPLRDAARGLKGRREADAQAELDRLAADYPDMFEPVEEPAQGVLVSQAS